MLRHHHHREIERSGPASPLANPPNASHRFPPAGGSALSPVLLAHPPLEGSIGKVILAAWSSWSSCLEELIKEKQVAEIGANGRSGQAMVEAHWELASLLRSQPSLPTAVWRTIARCGGASTASSAHLCLDCTARRGRFCLMTYQPARLSARPPALQLPPGRPAQRHCAG